MSHAHFFNGDDNLKSLSKRARDKLLLKESDWKLHLSQKKGIERNVKMGEDNINSQWKASLVLVGTKGPLAFLNEPAELVSLRSRQPPYGWEKWALNPSWFGHFHWHQWVFIVIESIFYWIDDLSDDGCSNQVVSLVQLLIEIVGGPPTSTVRPSIHPSTHPPFYTISVFTVSSKLIYMYKPRFRDKRSGHITSLWRQDS